MKKKTTKKKKMLVKEKKELMDKLIAFKEEEGKIASAMERLWKREEKLKERQRAVCDTLVEGFMSNREKFGNPIIYKNKHFQLLSGSYCSSASVTIKDIGKI